MLDCTTDHYDELYARWQKDPLDLPALAAWNRDEPLLDLCGGTGIIVYGQLSSVRTSAF